MGGGGGGGGGGDGRDATRRFLVVANYRTFQVISSWPDGGAVVRHARTTCVVRRNQGDQQAPTDFWDPKFNSNFDVEI